MDNTEKEGFSQMEKFVLKQNNDIYDNFYVDILVGSKVDQTKRGLEKIKKIASYFKILGAY